MIQAQLAISIKRTEGYQNQYIGENKNYSFITIGENKKDTKWSSTYSCIPHIQIWTVHSLLHALRHIHGVYINNIFWTISMVASSHPFPPYIISIRIRKENSQVRGSSTTLANQTQVHISYGDNCRNCIIHHPSQSYTAYSDNCKNQIILT